MKERKRGRGKCGLFGDSIQVYSNPSHNRPSIAVPAIQFYSKFSTSPARESTQNTSIYLLSEPGHYAKFASQERADACASGPIHIGDQIVGNLAVSLPENCALTHIVPGIFYGFQLLLRVILRDHDISKERRCRRVASVVNASPYVTKFLALQTPLGISDHLGNPPGSTVTWYA